MGTYGIPLTKDQRSKLHPLFICPCGAEHGDLTDHPQAERHCPAHIGKDGGYKGGAPEYVKGHEAPELFASFLDDHPEIPRPPGYEKAPTEPAPEEPAKQLEAAPEEPVEETPRVHHTRRTTRTTKKK